MVEDYSALDAIHGVDFDKYTEALGAGLGNGVISGLNVTAAGTLIVTIAAGTARVNGVFVGFGSSNTINFTGDPDGTNPRKALIVIDASGSIVRRLGTAAAANPAGEVRRKTLAPAPPELTAGDLVLAEIWMTASDTDIETADVSDRRINARDDPLNPSTHYHFFDDWLMSTTATGPTHDTFKEAIASGGTTVGVAGVPNGRLRLSTGTTTSGEARWETAFATFRRNLNALAEVSAMLQGSLIQCQSTIGFVNSQGIIIPGDTGDVMAAFVRNAGGSSTNWIAKTNDGGGDLGTETNTGIAPVLGTPQKFRIELDSGEVRFYIDDVLEATHTTNLPSTGTHMFFIHGHKTANTTDKDMDLDYTLIRADRS